MKPIDLYAAHEVDVDIIALHQGKDLGAAQHHIDAPGVTLIVG
jgi:hypothetical protein